MGGTCLNQIGIITPRMNQDQYKNLSVYVLNMIKLTLAISDREVKEIKPYRNKKDFGDIDILINSTNLVSNWVDILKKAFNSKGVIPNGDVVTFEINGYQVDIIKAPAHEFDAAYFYFGGYGSGGVDFGNFAGKIARRLGCKLGHDGLFYRYIIGDQLVKYIHLTSNPKSICGFLDIDFETYSNGFNDMTDAFELISTSQYFDPTIFAFEEMNSIARIRDKKRTSYHAFLDWIEANKDQFPFRLNREPTHYLKEVFVSFPDLIDELYDARDQVSKNREFKNKFNGLIVREVLGIDGKELGEWMQKNLVYFDMTMVLFSSDKVIREKILEIGNGN